MAAAGRDMAELIVPPALRDAHRRGLTAVDHGGLGNWRGVDRTGLTGEAKAGRAREERNGDFSQSPVVPIDLFTQQPFPGNRIPAERLHPVGRAIAKGLLDVRVHDLRQWATGVHRTVDDTPYGGGAGMVMRPEPLFAAVESISAPEVIIVRAEAPSEYDLSVDVCPDDYRPTSGVGCHCRRDLLTRRVDVHRELSHRGPLGLGGAPVRTGRGVGVLVERRVGVRRVEDGARRPPSAAAR